MARGRDLAGEIKDHLPGRGGSWRGAGTGPARDTRHPGRYRCKGFHPAVHRDRFGGQDPAELPPHLEHIRAGHPGPERHGSDVKGIYSLADSRAFRYDEGADLRDEGCAFHHGTARKTHGEGAGRREGFGAEPIVAADHHP